MTTAAPPVTLRVDLAERSYPILIGPGLIADAGRRVAEALPKHPVMVLTDSTVADLHLDPLMRSLAAADIRTADPIVAHAGEATKNLSSLGDVLEAMLSRGLERRTVLIALGGGVIGDLGGFAAAVALRGIDFVQVPTTLLAQVDSSVGGKTGVNSRHGKNLIGAFHQPRLVLADTGALDTLPRRALLAGYAEVAKYGLISDPKFFAWLEAHGPALIDGDTAARIEAIRVSCTAKADVVARDERESGLRELLNLGHTFGHALEAEAGYGDALLHGEAVAIGMVMAFDLSVRLGICPAADLARVRAHLTAVGLPTTAAHLRDAVPRGDWTATRLVAHMAKDKKVRDGRLAFVLATGIGRAFLTRDIAVDAVLPVLQSSLDGR